MTTRRISLALFSVVCASLLMAQLPAVDLTMVPLEDGRYEVRLRPDMDFDGLFAAIVITMRWESGSNTTFTFDEAQEISDIGMSINPSGTAEDVGAFRYLSYAGFGGAPFFSSGYSWLADQEVVLGHFVVTNGPADVRIVNDMWTGENNGDYYISLNGQDRTGDIYETSTSISNIAFANATMAIVPNPTKYSARLNVEWPVSESIRIEVLDAIGRVNSLKSFASAIGTNTIPLDATALADGTYTIQLTGGAEVRSIKWIVQH